MPDAGWQNEIAIWNLSVGLMLTGTLFSVKVHEADLRVEPGSRTTAPVPRPLTGRLLPAPRSYCHVHPLLLQPPQRLLSRTPVREPDRVVSRRRCAGPPTRSTPANAVFLSPSTGHSRGHDIAGAVGNGFGIALFLCWWILSFRAGFVCLWRRRSAEAEEGKGDWSAAA